MESLAAFGSRITRSMEDHNADFLGFGVGDSG